MVNPLGKPDNAADAVFHRNPKGTGANLPHGGVARR